MTADRTVEILEKTSPSMWHHVISEDNPADCPSRGLLPSELLGNRLWWKGPNFLQKTTNSWISAKADIKGQEIPELKVAPISILLTQKDNYNILGYLLTRCSSFSKLIRIIAYVYRFSNKCLARRSQNGALSLSELNNAKLCALKWLQGSLFSKELQLIKNNQQCSRALQVLTPFVDESGLLRVGGRLRFAPILEAAKHPILLPGKHELTKLCAEVHKLTVHGGPKLMQAYLQRTYWVLGLRNLVRNCVHNCATCYKFKAKPIHPITSELPPSRFVNQCAFYHTAVDYAGPFTIKESNRRKSPQFKVYVCIFVCMGTKAVHIELVSDLSTSAFLGALDRFVVRRGLCHTIYSDCGTNFQGAANQLKELLNSSKDTLIDSLSGRSINWQFNAPVAPNFGGLWEAAVKSFKFHLERVIGLHILTYEELYTVLTRVESVLNSRPLTPLSMSPSDDTDILTPGHFLIGSFMLAVAENNVEHLPINRLSRWQLLHQLCQGFWKRWKGEYLQTLLARQKWTTPISPIELGDLVILRGVDTSPLMWPIGRVTKVFPGLDGVTRVVEIRVGKTFLTRPLNKLSKFPPDSK